MAQILPIGLGPQSPEAKPLVKPDILTSRAAGCVIGLVTERLALNAAIGEVTLAYNLSVMPGRRSSELELARINEKLAAARVQAVTTAFDQIGIIPPPGTETWQEFGQSTLKTIRNTSR